MGLWVLAILIVLLDSITAQLSKTHWGLENEALIVPCPKNPNPAYPVDWHHPSSMARITTQKGHRVFASGNLLKFLPTEVGDSGIYTCIIKSPTVNFTRSVNLTIYQKQPNCTIPEELLYSTVSGTQKFSRIVCPTAPLYNWTAPLQWFKNCEALRFDSAEFRYSRSGPYLHVQNTSRDDEGDYTCKLIHNENGIHYTVTASRKFIFKESSLPLVPIIKAPLFNDTKEVEIGKAQHLICSSCMGKGPLFMASVRWLVNGINANGSGRIHQGSVQDERSGNGLICLKRSLMISHVKEEDLSLKLECEAFNTIAVTTHSISLRKKTSIGHQSLYTTVGGFSVLLMLISVFSVLLKVFWIDFILLWRDTVTPYKSRNDGKIYDAYVIYPRNCKDSPEGASYVEYFVHHILPDVLENKCGYNLCIYGRDLLPGEDAATAVETNIQKSRRHIFILTPEIAHCQEFAYEQEMALHNALIQNNSKVILIEMQVLSEQDGLPCDTFQESLQHLMKIQGTIKWREDHVANKLSLNSKFWKHVRYQMPVPNKFPKTPLN
ncbi:interleukin-1 receptor-like 1 [Echinops telfairi]|uniref:Interleukin-1 receptor-like 1 n=1 Tax=Echinops telfairi TaxID=9371 RepID=A0ABM0IP14_ECHTE|nr:interleukin-1 receptor-like 1 [Echinops telfairi]